MCSKGLYLDEKGDDDDDDENVSVRLIEWIETLKALGAGKVIMSYLIISNLCRIDVLANHQRILFTILQKSVKTILKISLLTS